MFLYLPDPAPLAVRCLTPGVLGRPEAPQRDDAAGRFSGDHDPLIRSVRRFEEGGSKNEGLEAR